MNDLAGKTCCVVGNGPSAPQNVLRIDWCDVVVRINAFPIGEAGSKWTAWYSAFMGFGREHQDALRMFSHPSRPGWVWMPGTINPRVCPFLPEKISFLPKDRLLEICRLHDRLSKVPKGRHPKTGKVRPIQPTSGIFVIDLALSMKPAKLVIVGFDAVAPGQPGWKHYGSRPAPWRPEKPSPSGGKHDYVLEKTMLATWLSRREFYGRKYPDTIPEWWRLK